MVTIINFTTSLLLLINCLVIEIKCKLIFNITENSMNKVMGMNIFSILGINDKNRTIIDNTVLVGVTSKRIINYLEIDRRNGNILLKSTIDREEVCDFGSRNDDCDLHYVLTWQDKVSEFVLRVLDVNDNAPVFKEKSVLLKIMEGETTKGLLSSNGVDKSNSRLYSRGGSGGKGQQIELPQAIDADSKQYSLKKYTVKFTNRNPDIQTKFNEFFKLINRRSESGSIIPELQTVKVLDRESVDRFDFTLVAWDQNDKTGECQIAILVQDINDNSPVWLGRGGSGNRRNNNNNNNINNNRGGIYFPQDSNTASAKPLPPMISVQECTRTREIAHLLATDADDSSTPNGQVEYSIVSVFPRGKGDNPNLSSSNVASQESSREVDGIFYLSGQSLQIDVVKMRSVTLRGITGLALRLRAQDGGGRASDITTEVRIVDCNDHRPNIEVKPASPRIIENIAKETKLTTIIVKDLDRGPNSNFDCKINEKHRFQLRTRMERILPSGGKLVIYELSTLDGVSFDREQSSSISVIISCSDRGSPVFTSTQSINVLIQDVNDNKPRFSRDFFSFSVAENSAIGTVIGRVTAKDLDAGENGRVTYSIKEAEDETSFFSINSGGQIQNSIELDREKTEQYKLVIVATDNGLPKRLSSTCTVSIIIADVNDCQPLLERQYYFEVEESPGFKAIHKVLGSIKAVDKDSGENGKLRYSLKPIHSESQYKSLVQITGDGQISIYGIVDRETTKSIRTEVMVQDHGEPPLSTKTSVIINVLDVNDNKPQFEYPSVRSSHNYANISLDSSAGTPIAQILATDPDNGVNGTVTFQLLGGPSVKDLFELHSGGQLILMKSLSELVENEAEKMGFKTNNKKKADRNSRKSLSRRFPRKLPDRLLIQASDEGKPSQKEITTLYLRYYNEANKESSKTDLDKRRRGNKDALGSRGSGGSYTGSAIDLDDRNQSEKQSANVSLLYGLAVVLFVVFAAVLMLLVFVFLKSRRATSQEYSPEKSGSRNRKSTTVTLKQSVNTCHRKSADDLLSGKFYNVPGPNVSQKDNYNQLLWVRGGLGEPHYNLLYPTPNSRLAGTGGGGGGCIIGDCSGTTSGIGGETGLLQSQPDLHKTIPFSSDVFPAQSSDCDGGSISQHHQHQIPCGNTNMAMRSSVDNAAAAATVTGGYRTPPPLSPATGMHITFNNLKSSDNNNYISQSVEGLNNSLGLRRQRTNNNNNNTSFCSPISMERVKTITPANENTNNNPDSGSYGINGSSRAPLPATGGGITLSNNNNNNNNHTKSSYVTSTFV